MVQCSDMKYPIMFGSECTDAVVTDDGMDDDGPLGAVAGPVAPLGPCTHAHTVGRRHAELR